MAEASGMMQMVQAMLFWHWWVFGVVLIIVEILVPSTFFLWPGMAALVTGLLLLLVPGLAWQWQWLLWGVLAITSVGGWRMYQKRHPERSDHPLIHQRGKQYVGHVYALEHAIVNGVGKVRIGDTLWRVEGPDQAQGTRVRVVEADGVILRVQSAE
jgi:membrane protein implicated in regulation of membrane protease activity